MLTYPGKCEHLNRGLSIRGFPLVPYMGMGLRLASLEAAGAPLQVYM